MSQEESTRGEISFELVEDGAALEIDASGAYCSCKCPDDPELSLGPLGDILDVVT